MTRHFLLDCVPVLNNIVLTDNVSKQVDILNDVFIDCHDACVPPGGMAVKGEPTPWTKGHTPEAAWGREDSQRQLKIDTSASR